MIFLIAFSLGLFYDGAAVGEPLEKYPFRADVIRQRLAEECIELRPLTRSEDIWVFWNLGSVRESYLKGSNAKQKVLFTFEPPTVQPKLFEPRFLRHFDRVYTWNDELVDGVRFFKFYYPVLRKRVENVPSFEEKKFCTMVARRLDSKHPDQLYSEREKTIRFFEDKKGELDLYGMYWEKRQYKNYRGKIDDKIKVIKNYKYCICYENTRNTKGYITEKIFDCFAAGVVPVYWGADNVEKYIPKECFIDRRKFADHQAMYRFLKGISKERYEAYLKAAETFLQSEEAKLFSEDYFIETFLSTVQNPSS